MVLDKHGRSLTERLSRARLESRDISELIGICKGVLADGVISYPEAFFILGWLEEHRIITDVWPASILYQSLDNMLEDLAVRDFGAYFGNFDAKLHGHIKVYIYTYQ